VGELAQAIGALAPGHEVMVRRIQAIVGAPPVETKPGGVAQKNAQPPRPGGSTTEGLTVLDESSVYRLPERRSWTIPAVLLAAVLLVGLALFLRGSPPSDSLEPSAVSAP